MSLVDLNLLYRINDRTLIKVFFFFRDKKTLQICLKMASRKNRKHALQRSASTLTASTLSSTSSKTASTFSRIWGSFRRSQSSSSVLSDGFKVVDDNGRINVEIIKSISELDNSVVSFNHGMVETIPPGKERVIKY